MYVIVVMVYKLVCCMLLAFGRVFTMSSQEDGESLEEKNTYSENPRGPPVLVT